VGVIVEKITSGDPNNQPPKNKGFAPKKGTFIVIFDGYDGSRNIPSL